MGHKVRNSMQGRLDEYLGTDVVSPIVFYTYGKSIELNGRLFDAGELTENLLNLTDDFRPMRECFERMVKLTELYRTKRQIADWISLIGEMERLCSMLRKYMVFRLLLNENEDRLFSEARLLTEKYGDLPEHEYEPTEQNLEMLCKREEFLENEGDPQIVPEIPPSLLLYFGGMEQKWRYFELQVDRYMMYLHDIHAFNETIQNFINFILSGLKTNSPESYATALYDFYNDPRLVQKLIVNPIMYGVASYRTHDNFRLSYLPRKMPDGHMAICQEHVTNNLQGLMKADYMLALSSGYQIRRCRVCHKYFLLKSGAHALYCEGACPHAPEYTCRQFGTHEVQKELFKDVPKVRAKLAAFERITKDRKRGAISKEDERTAKDYVRDKLYDAMRDKDMSVEDFEQAITSEKVYRACFITRQAKPRGRPKKTESGDTQ